MNGTFLLVGLGNPGRQYAATRHNVGQMVLDNLARSTGGTFRSARRAQAVVIEGYLGTPGQGSRTVLAKTSVFMNVSGGPVAGLASFYGVGPDHVVVVHDDLDLPFGTIRLKQGGGEGGHNGLRDITKALGTKDYLRVRVGVGRPPGRKDPADHVLSAFTTTERKDLDLVLADAAQAAELLVLEGLTKAQQTVHASSGTKETR
jgi:PTH1 family peptidyl-tRNA hydrolase